MVQPAARVSGLPVLRMLCLPELCSTLLRQASPSAPAAAADQPAPLSFHPYCPPADMYNKADHIRFASR